LRSEGFGTHVTGIGYGVWANLACSLASAGCVALGYAKSPDMNDPKNWASWAALLVIFGGVTFVGTGANGARLWLKKRNIGRAPGDRLAIVLADLCVPIMERVLVAAGDTNVGSRPSRCSRPRQRTGSVGDSCLVTQNVRCQGEKRQGQRLCAARPRRLDPKRSCFLGRG
jgi:hypothetical protein